MTLEDVKKRLDEITTNAGSDLAIFQQQVNTLNADIANHLQQVFAKEDAPQQQQSH